MPNPLVAVCIPTFEPDPAHLREAIDSVLAQTVSDWELLIHDDASSGDIAAMVRPYLTDARIRFVRSEKRLGIGGNWNAAAAATSAPLIAYLFQDDTWHPAYVERALRALEEHPSAGMVALQHSYTCEMPDAPVRLYDEVKNLRDHLFRHGSTNGAAFLREWIARELHPNIVGEPSFVVIQRQLLERIGGWNTRMHQCLDSDGWTRMLPLTDIAMVPDDSGVFRVHEDGASARNRRDGRGLTDRLRILWRLSIDGPPSLRLSAIRSLCTALPKSAWRFMQRCIGH